MSTEQPLGAQMTSSIFNSAYCTLDDVVEQMLLPDSSALDIGTTAQSVISKNSASANTFLKTLILDWSNQITEAAFRTFVPYDFTHYHDPADIRFYDDLILRDDLLSVTTLTNGDDTTLLSTQYRLLERGIFPAWKIKTLSSQSAGWVFNDGDSQIAILGTWGYNTRPASMWSDSGQVIPAGNLTDSATTLTLVTDVSGLETYQYIKVNSEYMFITAIDVDNVALTLERGVNGSTAAAHTSADVISTYVQTPEIRRECRRLVIRDYHLRGEVHQNVVATAESSFELKPGRVKLSPVLIRKVYYAV